jgi:N-acetylglucosaminyldiphosphoundecaprenol N-acetyl-beta-D-mannosaminyltransferase
MMDEIKILDIPIANINKEELLQKIDDHFQTPDGNLFFVTANPEIIMMTKSSNSYKEAITSADYILADGIGVLIASKILGSPLREKLPGYELMHDFLAYANYHGKTVYFFGAKPGVAEQAAKNAKNQYRGLKVAGFMDGYTNKGPLVANEIAETKPDFVFVAMGAPLQERWIAKYRGLFPTSVLIGVGGSLDVLSGNVKRAPKFWTNNNLEWLYRLLTQPTRAKRMMKIPVFLVHVVREKFSK